MKRFKNILIGVDLSDHDRIVNQEPATPSQEALKRAIWHANDNSAKLTILFSLDISEKAQQMLKAEEGSDSTILNKANEALAKLVEQAQQQGVEATAIVVCGRPWLELIQQSQKGEHDLVIVGTKNRGAFSRFLLGSTCIKLLRKCPCPVWVTKPQDEHQIASILIADDLHSVGELTSELGCSMAEIYQSQLHVLHALPYWDDDKVMPTHALPQEEIEAHTQQVQEKISAKLSGFNFAAEPIIHVVLGPPEDAILKQIKEDDIELLVMGTLARAGIEGIITGNTAEQLLPQVSCSVLAVKPAGFRSPVLT